MSSDKAARWLRDIIEQAERIGQHIDGFDEAAFCRDAKTVDAVERCLGRITEAAIRVRDNAPEAAALPDEWLRICGLGNSLRHEYDKLALNEIWRMAAQDTPALADACRAKLRELES